MPKGHHATQKSLGYYHTTPVTTSSTQYSNVSSRPDISSSYYSPLDSNMSQQSYSPQNPYPNGGPVQLPISTSQYASQLPPAPLPSIRPSSGAWNPTDDQTLMSARAQGMNWAPIQQAYFPNKTPNACRKRHERLMERRSADDWDGMKLENMAKTYMGMRREIWGGLAAQTGEKWNVVEQKCMSQGLKNLQTAARSCARRERMIDTSASMGGVGRGGGGAVGHAAHTDDSGIGMDDLEAEYDHSGLSDHSPSDGQLRREYSDGSHDHHYQRGSYGRQEYHHHERLPSMDMGIGSIINRPNGR